MSELAKNNTRERLFYLDFVRAFACLCILIVHFNAKGVEDLIYNQLKDNVKKYYIKSKSIHPDGSCELTLELAVVNENTQFLNTISKLEGVHNAVLVSYNGDFSI